jgi:hypothetical protein
MSSAHCASIDGNQVKAYLRLGEFRANFGPHRTPVARGMEPSFIHNGSLPACRLTVTVNFWCKCVVMASESTHWFLCHFLIGRYPVIFVSYDIIMKDILTDRNSEFRQAPIHSHWQFDRKMVSASKPATRIVLVKRDASVR